MTQINGNSNYLVKEKIKQTWHYLSDDEIAFHENMRDVFFIAIRKKHGTPRAQAEEIMKSILNGLDFLSCEGAA